MKINVLALGDTANVIRDLKKYSKKIEIHHIDFPDKKKFLIKEKDTEIFESHNLLQQLDRINKIKEKYDFCLVMGWSSARLAYLAGMDYVIYFVGADIKTPNFRKWESIEHPKRKKNNLSFAERGFFKRVFVKSLVCVTTGQELFEILKKYRNDAIRFDRIVCDVDIFNSKIEPIKLEKKKFTFFCPQTIGIRKGSDIIWKALPLCKSDFEVIQVEWYDLEPYEKNTNYFIKNKPSQIRFIPLIRRDEMASYYNFADAVLGNMRMGLLESIGREAAICRKPLINYSNHNKKTVIDGKEVTIPFVPTSQDPVEVAKVIDKIVQSKEFRDELVEKQYAYVKELTDPHKAAAEWENLFERLLEKRGPKRKKSPNKVKLRTIYCRICRTITRTQGRFSRHHYA